MYDCALAAPVIIALIGFSKLANGETEDGKAALLVALAGFLGVMLFDGH